MARHSFKASVLDCGYCSNLFHEPNSVIVHSADRKTHKTCLGTGEVNSMVVMDRNHPETPMTLRDSDPTCKCADCFADLPVESTTEDEE